MEFSAQEISTLLHGKLEGDPSVKVFKPAKIEEAQQGDICFLGNPKYLQYAYSTNASIILVNENIYFEKAIKPAIIRVKDAHAGMAVLLDHYKNNQQVTSNEIETHSYISGKAKMGNNVSVGAFSYISEHADISDDVFIHAHVFIGRNVQIGKKTTLFPGVVVLDDCIVGENCILNANAVIGSEGFGFVLLDDGTYKKIAQTGNVIIESDVEIGSNTTIDRATMGSTIIRKGVKIDNLVQIAHNVEIGENTVIAAQSGIAGSTKIGRNCVLGGQVGIVGHLIIADGTKINAQSGVNKSITESNTSLTGSPAFAFAANMRSQVIYKKLPELYNKILDLEKEIRELRTEKGENAK
ncbi:MAG: UDP-3-O-(3-hydroxymyristoyl)glucosamine N-acyltransferase [Chitinophagales bacterium]|nr:UDP-3-O-(3-hydroxymyristoyl)glucosamine N-acyltransferase [Chitinophagales bacterium]